jgi:hypothetical protein
MWLFSFYGERQSPPLSTIREHHPAKKGLVWISNSFVTFRDQPTPALLSFFGGLREPRGCAVADKRNQLHSFSRVRLKPSGHQIFSAASDDQFLSRRTKRREVE